MRIVFIIFLIIFDSAVELMIPHWFPQCSFCPGVGGMEVLYLVDSKSNSAFLSLRVLRNQKFARFFLLFMYSSISVRYSIVIFLSLYPQMDL